MPYPPEFTTIFLVVFLLSTFLTAGLFGLAKQVRLLPAIRERDVHTVRKPRIGGLAIWLAVIMTFFWLARNPATSQLLDFGNPTHGGIDRALWGIMAGMGVLLITGLIDDIWGLSWPYQLLGQLGAVLLLALFGVGAQYIRLPFDYLIPLDHLKAQLPLWLGGGTIWVWSALFTVGWVMTMINVLNFFDGLDGLAGSVAMTASLVLVFVGLRVGFGLIAAATLAIILLAATAGFLPWNWHPAKIFMGTVGSQILGFLLGVIAIISGGKVATAVLVLGIPLFDAVIVIVRRLLAGQSPFKADQRHLHHRLLKIGLSVPAAVILINIVAVTFGLLALRTQESTQKGMLTLLLAACMALFIYITYLLERRVET